MTRLGFGPSVKKARVKRDMTQQELAEKLKNPQITRAIISHWENENSFPSIKKRRS